MPNNFLTKEGYQKLQDELEFLRTAKRQEVASRLHEAMEGGELIENAEYEAAKNEQAFVEGKIQDLENLLAAAKIITEKKYVIQEEGTDVKETYILVGAAEADPMEGKISNESPLGKALANHTVGDVVTIDAPDGKFNVKIIKVS